MARYQVTQTPDRRRWVILDRHLYGFCALPADEDASSLLPLEWYTKHGAQAWLNKCYLAWQNGTVPAPDDWRPFKDTPSPWAVEPEHDRPNLANVFNLWQ